MASKKGGRIHYLAVIFLGIIAIHAVVLSCIVPDQAPPVTPEEISGDKPSATAVPDTRAAGKDLPAQSTPSAPAHRTWQKSTNPLFGRKLDFSRAIHGNSIEKFVPGAKNAVTGIIVDMDTRKVLWEKNSSRRVQIASMTKMMTMLLTFEALDRDPALSLDTTVTIPQDVMKVPRTGVLWLSPGERFTLRELLLGTAVKSANDAAEVCAITIAGSVDKFIRMMNQKSASLGLSANFTTTHGLPDKNKKTSTGSAVDMVMLGERLLEYPELMKFLSVKQGHIREGSKKTIFVNTNGLINPHYPGVDGMKTGYTRAAGSCLTFSAMRDGRRIIGCVTGFKSSKDRNRFSRKLIDWAYRQKK